MLLRCLIDGLLLPAEFAAGNPPVVAHDGEDSFRLEALEARFYEIVLATPDEWLEVERAHYRLLRRAGDFQWETA